MNIKEALSVLGCDRVIWIDDHFREDPKKLAEMLVRHMEIARECKFEELDAALEQAAFDEDRGTVEIEQALVDLGKDRLAEIRDTFLRAQQGHESTPVKELDRSLVDKICDILGVAEGDRWDFDGYDQKVKAIAESGDGNVAYMIDLKDSYGATEDHRGLEVIRTLKEASSEASSFILTHEAVLANEGALEARLMDKLSSEERREIAICVISKERLQQDAPGADAVQSTLRLAIKRAGLKRSLHEVLRKARGVIADSFEEAQESLLRVEPEALERHVVERAIGEGVTEMHVIERALNARMSNRVRKLFAVDNDVLKSNRRMREMQAIKLDTESKMDSDIFSEFRKDEIWDDADIVNNSFSPLMCGDVFEYDTSEKLGRGANSNKFVLLGQACDIAIRSKGGRKFETAILAVLKPASSKKGDKKEAGRENYFELPFDLEGARWGFSLRDSAPVRLSILDLASFRSDGCVKYEHDQCANENMLPGISDIFEDRTSKWRILTEAAKSSQNLQGHSAIMAGELQLVLSSEKSFKSISIGSVVQSEEMKGNIRTADRVVWPIRRKGRLRVGYAEALWDAYIDMISRRAYELDFGSEAITGTDDEEKPDETFDLEAVVSSAEKIRESVDDIEKALMPDRRAG